MSEVVLRVDDLSKKFCISLKRSLFYGAVDTLKSILGIEVKTKLRVGEFWALNDISFDLKRGETLGIIGSNGSGKSTLLRMITGIFPPDTGRISVKGRVGSLIAVGAGFHPHMTGRENIYLNGTILGMSKKELELNLEEIIDFAEIGEFIDAPVSTYSSGMRVRLGFSIAIHSSPDILLVDEVLSVGDISFRNRCLRKIYELKNSSKAIIFISHDLDQVKNLCSRIIWLEKGRVLQSGDPEKTIVDYINNSFDARRSNLACEYDKKADSTSYQNDVELITMNLKDQTGNTINNLQVGDPLKVEVFLNVKKAILKPNINIGIRDDKNINIIWHNSNESELDLECLDSGKYKLSYSIRNPYLSPNVYRVVLGIGSNETGEQYAKIISSEHGVFTVKGNKYPRGYINCLSHWEIGKL